MVDRDLSTLQLRLAELVRRAGDSSPDDDLSLLLDESFDALGLVLEQRRLAGEHSHVQTDQLAHAPLGLELERARYQDLFVHAPDAYLVVSRSGAIAEANAAAASLLGFAPASAVGEPLVKYIAPKDKLVFFEAVRALGAGRAFAPTEFELHPRSGVPVHCLARATAIREPHGAVSGSRWMVTDVSERKAAELRLEDALSREREDVARLRGLDDQKALFLLAVSHDLRSPMSAIGLLAESAQRRPPPPEELHRFLRRISENVRSAQAVLDDLTDLDRLLRKDVTPFYEPVPLEPLLRAAASTVQEGRGVEVDVESGLVAWADARLVRRIIENLVANAVRHTASGTPITLRAEKNEFGVRLSVEDRGTGVPDEEKALVFEPFHAHASAGLGIGLHLVSRLAKLNGGRVWVDDRPGGGAAFRVELLAG